jgi:hypothetical protein
LLQKPIGEHHLSHPILFSNLPSDKVIGRCWRICTFASTAPKFFKVMRFSKEDKWNPEVQKPLLLAPMNFQSRYKIQLQNNDTLKNSFT